MTIVSPPRVYFLFITMLLVFGMVFLAHPLGERLTSNLTQENFLELVNQDRLKNGLPPLKANSRLIKAAYAKAFDMLQNNYFAHISPEGKEAWDFLKNTGIEYVLAGENLALNYTNPYELENSFLQSPPHRQNLLSPLFSETGIAIVQGLYQGKPAIVTVQLFAR